MRKPIILTEEDSRILAARWTTEYLIIHETDADLMLGLAMDRAAGEAWLRIGSENYRVPHVHLCVRKNSRWPSRWILGPQ